ncbi:ATP-binding protein [Chitinophaga agrisoli]|uniref:ATP-binding protein n=1 Tax=Chitinophaga agrisoli TaxID=2607653 RepID=A0A5B2VIB7_9BACT|nr:ATP-binding protein [Chitinophaga agrisoli]KAA2238821.1 ATP-binding protein [Chitinophaga agrisoli]
MPLDLLFLAGIGYRIVNKSVKTIGNSDDVGVCDVIGGFLGNLVNGVTGNYASEKIVSLVNKLKQDGLSADITIQRNIRKSFLLAAIYPAKLCYRNSLYDNNTERQALEEIIRYLKNELKKAQDLSYSPLEENTTDKVYGYLLKKLDHLHETSSIEDIDCHLSNSLIYELNAHLYAKGKGCVPPSLEKMLRDGWVEGESQFTLFSFMSGHFHAVLTADKDLSASVEREWLAGIAENANIIRSVSAGMAAELKEIGKDCVETSESIDKVLTLLESPLRLRYNFEGIDYHNAHFKSRYTPFVGREQELETLENFIDSPKRLEWWVITAAGGSGKSRLALELCYNMSYYGKQWDAGLLNSQQLNIDWNNWQPLAPTLIIVDYAAGYYERLINILTILKERMLQLKHPVRFLLLERYAEGKWWEEFEKSYQLLKDIPPVFNAAPLVLPELGDAALWKIMDFTLTQANKVLPDREQTLARLKSIDKQGRPLFAFFAAIALSDGENIRNWNVEHLVQYQLSREEKHIWRVQYNDPVLIEQHKNLVALATMTNGLKQADVATITSMGFAWLPKPEQVNTELFKCIAHYIEVEPDTKSYRPYEPDIVGEYLILQQLAPDKVHPLKDKEKNEQLVTFAWENYAFEMFLTCKRVYNDFYGHPLKTDMMRSPGPESSQKHKHIWVWAAKEILPVIAKNGDFDATLDVYNAYSALARELNVEPVFGMQMVLVGAIMQHFCNQPPSLLLPVYEDCLFMIQRNVIETPWITDICKIATILLRAFLDKEPAMSLKIYDDISAIALAHPTEEIVAIQATCAGRLAFSFAADNPAKALYYFEECKKMAAIHPLETIYTELARLAFNLSAEFGNHNHGNTKAFYEYISDLSSEKPVEKIILYQAQTAVNTMGFLGKSEPTYVISCYRSIQSLAQKYLTNELMHLQANAALNIITHLFDDTSVDIVPYYEEIRELAFAHAFPELLVKYAQAIAYMVEIHREKDFNKAVFYYEDMRKLTQQFTLDDLYVVHVISAHYLIKTACTNEVELVQSLYSEIELISQKAKTDRIVSQQLESCAFIIVHFGLSNLPVSAYYLESIKQVLTENSTKELVMAVVRTYSAIIAGLHAIDFHYILPYYEELRSLGMQYQEKEILIEQANAVYHLCINPGATACYDDIKSLAIQHPFEELLLIQAKTIGRSIYFNIKINANAEGGLRLLLSEMIPLADRMQHPKAFLEAGISVVIVISELHNRLPADFLTRLQTMLKGLVETFRDHPDWTEHKEAFDNFCKSF